MFHITSYSHFVPLCRTLDSSAPKIPSNCQPAFYRCSRSIGKQYVNYNLDGSFSTGIPVLFSEVQSTHLFKTMGYRFKPHKPEQPGFFHGLIDKLIEKAFQELSIAFSDNNSSLSSSSNSIKMSLNGDNDCQHEESKMTATNLFIKVRKKLGITCWQIIILLAI